LTQFSFNIYFKFDKGNIMDADSIKEKANSADENITFTDDACEALTQVPDFAMDMAINHMVNAAKDQGVDTIDPAFLEANNPMG
jgi:hypothetical protein|tara:strand:- start:64 stop:315 length:252 start_codon:yes stop_codon:yes gene_type:complete